MEFQPDEKSFRSYLLLWSGQLTSLLGSSAAQFVIIWWITIETQSSLYLALASFSGLVPIVLLSPFAGVFVDRWSRKMLIGIVDFLQALATMVLIFLFWLGNVAIWHVFLILILRGIFQAFHSPAASAIIPLMVPKSKLSRMNGLNYLLSGAVTLTGPVIAAVLLSFWQVYDILWIDVLTFMVAIVPLLIVKIPSIRMQGDDSSFKEDFREGLTFIKNARGLLPLLLVATALNFLLTPLSTLLPYYVKFDHFGEVTDLAFVLALFEGGMLAGGLFMSVTKGFRRKAVAISISIYFLFFGYALIALSPTGMFWFMALSGLFAAFWAPIANVTIQTIFQTVVPMKMQGRVSSVTMAMAIAAQPIGMILSGVIVEFTRTSYLFLACAGLGMLTLTVAWFFTDMRHVEKIEETSNNP